MTKNLLYLILFFGSLSTALAQKTFTRKDSLQGGLRKERTCFDVMHYGLNITVDIATRTIKGYNDIQFKVVENTSKIQLDLFANLDIDSIVYQHKVLKYKREFNAVFIDFPTPLLKGKDKKELRFYYSGKPIVAKNAPWDGGFIFDTDTNGKPWVAVAVQGTGACAWFPVKDTQTDEPDNGATIQVAVPNGLVEVSNGRLRGTQDLKNGSTRWDWEVKNPINTYDITLNIGDYVHFGEKYKGLDLDFYALKVHEAKARKQFEEVKPMLDCFQSKFGEYPFAQDGYKLVETPYLGMEHQSAVSYGNHFQKGYLGNDLSGTGIGLLFDYIIVHESGHEWFGNSITSKDIADMWIHEGFTMYSEAVYLECHYGYEKSQIYLNGLKQMVENDRPILGKYGVNKEGSGDMYPKGALMLNTIRHLLNDDDKWWSILKKYAETFKYKIIDTETVISFFNTETGMNLTPVFYQYLKYTHIPTFEYKIEQDQLQYRWKSDETNFNMAVEISIDGKKVILKPTTTWQTYATTVSKNASIEVDTKKEYIEYKKTL